MFRFYFSRIYKARISLANGESTTTSGLFQTPFLTRSFGANTASDERSLGASYLINSCGLSEKTAISVSKQFRLIGIGSPQPDKDLTTSGSNKFSITDIPKKRRFMQLSKADQTIRNKIEFFKSIGLSSQDLETLLMKAPTILFRSVEKELRPSFVFLKTIIPSECDVVRMIKYSPWLFAHNPASRLGPNIAALQSHGVPIGNIHKLLEWSPITLIRTTAKRLSEIGTKAVEMQFEPSKFSFLRAVQALACVSMPAWEAKKAIYRSWGWSEDDCTVAFKRQPQCMMISEKKITGCMEFFVKKMGYDSLLLAKNPMLLMYSLEKRTIPRLSVIRVLIANNIVDKDVNVGRIMQVTDEAFLKEFVAKYEDQLPELRDVYMGKTKCSSK